MKIVRKISTCIFLLGFLCGVCAIPIVILGLPELTNIYRSRVDTNLGDWVAILGLGGVLLGFFITVLILIRVIRQVVLPVRIAEKKDSRAAKPFILYETGPLGVFDAIVPEYLGGVFYGALCESVASEQAARRTAGRSLLRIVPKASA